MMKLLVSEWLIFHCHMLAVGQKSPRCNVCPYSAVQSGHLIQHMRTHTGEKPFKCKVCQYSTISSGALIRHMRKHTSEKPYKCNVCEYSTSYSSDLRRHAAKKHADENPQKVNIEEYAPQIRDKVAWWLGTLDASQLSVLHWGTGVWR